MNAVEIPQSGFPEECGIEVEESATIILSERGHRFQQGEIQKSNTHVSMTLTSTVHEECAMCNSGADSGVAR